MFGSKNNNEVVKKSKSFYERLKAGYIIIAVAYVVFGVSLLIKPEMSSTVICFTIGTFCLIYAIATLIRYFIEERRRYYIEPDFVLPVIMLVFGMVIIFRPSVIISILPVVVGVVMVVSGIVKLQESLSLKKYFFAKWWTVLIFSIISVVLGIVILINPFGTGLLFIRIVGLCFAVDGLLSIISNIMLKVGGRY